MKRIGIVLGGFAWTVLLATPALAQSSIPGPDVRGEVLTPPIVTPPGGTAFTGTDISVWMVMMSVMFVAGAALVLAGRRRAKRVRV